MTLLFDRKYELSIGTPNYKIPTQQDLPLKEGYTKFEWQPEEDFRTEKTDTGIIRKNGVLITDLQIIADIKATANSSSTGNSSSTIQIYNMSKTTRELVEKINNYVILKAGYAQDQELLMVFAGQVMNYSTVRKGQDLITTLSLKTGYSVDNSIRISKSFPDTATYADVIEYLAGVYADNGVAKGDLVYDWSTNSNTIRNESATGLGTVLTAKPDIQDYNQLPVMKLKPAHQQLVTGYTGFGYLSQVLQEVCDQIGYVSYITNNRLFVHPKGFTKTIEQFEFTTKQMKSIRSSADQTTSSSVGKGTSGVKIITFLDGRLDVDKRIKVLDGDHQGSYKVTSKEHYLDYQYGRWDTTITCTKETN